MGGKLTGGKLTGGCERWTSERIRSTSSFNDTDMTTGGSLLLLLLLDCLTVSVNWIVLAVDGGLPLVTVVVDVPPTIGLLRELRVLLRVTGIAQFRMLVR